MHVQSGVQYTNCGVAPGARATPCWIVLESFYKRETCFAGRISCAWNGGPSLAEPPRGTERACLREATADLAEKAFGRLELCCNERHSGYALLILRSCDFQFKTSHYLTSL